MAQVHPTAIVDDRVHLGKDVIVGAQCILEGRVTVGDGTRLLPRVIIRGTVNVGQRNIIYPNACIGYAPQDLKFDPANEGAGVLIGSDNIIREGVTIHRATGDHPTTLGDHNYLMCNSHMAHDTAVGHYCMFANGALLAGHVRVFDRAILGGNAAIHQFARVGRLAMVSGGVAMAQDTPPFCIAHYLKRVGSLNLVGLRRAGLREHIKPLQRAFDLLYRQHHLPARAAELILEELGDDPLCREFAEFVTSSKRGVSKYLHAAED